ncbi:MAG TPA: T9SS type A sorting domain-containing protein [Candidatus Kapabacteria bacterium]|nr:T9SS type A sorting domain-containing protein [Candidatus Kapabacteria bacterium]
MALGSDEYSISRDGGINWQSQSFPFLGNLNLSPPSESGLLLVNGHAYTISDIDEGDPYEYILARFDTSSMTWSAVSDWQGDHIDARRQGSIAMVTTLRDSLFYYSINTVTRDSSFHPFDSEFIYCITPTQTFQPLFIGIDENAINNMSGAATGGDLFAAVRAGVYVSTDEGNHWSTADTNFADTTINQLLAALNGDLYAITASGNLYRSMNEGASWIFLNDELKGSTTNLISTSTGVIIANAYSFLYNSGTPMMVSGVYALTDSGRQWQKINYGVLDTTKFYTIAADSAGYVYAASDSIIYRTTKPVTAVSEDRNNIPASFSLSQNFPNPFSSQTEIAFSLPFTEYTTLKIYNALGQLIATPISAKLSSGSHNIAWNSGALPSGVYYYQLQTPFQTALRAMAIAK